MKKKKLYILLAGLLVILAAFFVVWAITGSVEQESTSFAPESISSTSSLVEIPAIYSAGRGDTSQSAGATSTALTDASDNQPVPPDPPEMEGDITDPDNPPSYASSSNGTGEPTPGQTRPDGAVYDPVFGWIYPTDGQGENVDNDKDPDKQVGDM